jgi:hypothetical protein
LWIDGSININKIRKYHDFLSKNRNVLGLKTNNNKEQKQTKQQHRVKYLHQSQLFILKCQCILHIKVLAYSKITYINGKNYTIFLNF